MNLTKYLPRTKRSSTVSSPAKSGGETTARRPIAPFEFSPEVQGQAAELSAKLKELATLKANQEAAADAAYASRFETFANAAKTRIEPAKLKSEDNPGGVDLEAVFAKFNAGGCTDSLHQIFAAMPDHPLFQRVKLPVDPSKQTQEI